MAGLKIPRVKLLKGNSPDIVNSNITSLKNAGLSHPHATHLALKVANTGLKLPKLTGMGVPKIKLPTENMRVKMPNPFPKLKV